MSSVRIPLCRETNAGRHRNSLSRRQNQAGIGPANLRLRNAEAVRDVACFVTGNARKKQLVFRLKGDLMVARYLQNNTIMKTSVMDA